MKYEKTAAELQKVLEKEFINLCKQCNTTANVSIAHLYLHSSSAWLTVAGSYNSILNLLFSAENV